MPSPAHKDEEAALPAKDVVLVAFDGINPIDIAGPASVFSDAEMLRPGSYRVHIASPIGGTVETNSGLSLASTVPLAAVTGPIDTLIVAGGDEPAVRAAIFEHGMSAWLAEAAPRVRRLASVCTGAFTLAAAGLLDDREATTHWRACELLQTLRPQVRVQHERIYVRDGNVWTSAGVTTGIELALALVEDDLGHEVSIEIARTLALPMLRGGEQPQLSTALQAQAQASHRLRELIAWIGTHLQEDLSVDALAERAHESAALRTCIHEGNRLHAGSPCGAAAAGRCRAALATDAVDAGEGRAPQWFPLGGHVATCVREASPSHAAGVALRRRRATRLSFVAAGDHAKPNINRVRVATVVPRAFPPNHRHPHHKHPASQKGGDVGSPRDMQEHTQR